jgi:hypothetical protein
MKMYLKVKLDILVLSYVSEPIIVGPSSVGCSHVVNDVFEENSYRNMVLHAMGVGDAYSNDMVSSSMIAEELSNPEADKFYKLLKAAEESLWDGCTKQSKLFACVQLLNMKSTLNLTQTAFNKFTEFTKVECLIMEIWFQISIMPRNLCGHLDLVIINMICVLIFIRCTIG